MKSNKIKDYLVENHLDLILGMKDDHSFTSIAKKIIEVDELLSENNPERLRKSVSRAISSLEPKSLIIESNTSNVLVIGDLHEPFCLDGYLDFCIEQQKKWNCDKVIFIGDVIDNHYASYHEPR